MKAAKKHSLTPVGRWGSRETGIIEVATRLFSDRGYDGVTMAAVASECGLSEGTLYNYFRDKRDLALRVTLAAFERHTDEAAGIVNDSTSLRDGLEKLIALELRILIEARSMVALWLREVRGAPEYPSSAARDVLRRFSGQLIALLQKWDYRPAAETGLSHSLIRDIMFGGVEHIVWTAIVQKRAERLDAETLAHALAGLYLRAFGAAPEVPQRKSRVPAPKRAAKRKPK